MEEFSKPTRGDLIDAIKASDVALVAYLLDQGADVNECDEEWLRPALSHALNVDSTEIAKLLIEKGAYINTADRFGSTPLMFAAQNGVIILRILIEKGAELDAIDGDGDAARDWIIPVESLQLLIAAPELQRRIAAEKAAQEAAEAMRKKASVAHDIATVNQDRTRSSRPTVIVKARPTV